MSLAHRALPFRATWTVERRDPGRLRARLTLDDPALFTGHFPGRPLLPGMLLIELLLGALRDDLQLDPSHRLTRLSCRLRRPLGPGDPLEADITIDRSSTASVEANAHVTTQGIPVASVSLHLDGTAGENPKQSNNINKLTDRPFPESGAKIRPLDREFIAKVLPHRRPMLLVDDAQICPSDPNHRPLLWASHRAGSEDPCAGDLGQTDTVTPRYPPPLLVESACQACGLLRAAVRGRVGPHHGTPPMVARVADARFATPVLVGQTVEHQVRLLLSGDSGVVFDARSTVNGETVMQVKRIVVSLAGRSGAV